MGQNRFKKLSKFQKFQLSNFTLTWSNEGKMNSVRLDTTYSIELQQKMKMLDKPILKNILIRQFQSNTLPWPYLGTAIVSNGY